MNNIAELIERYVAAGMICALTLVIHMTNTASCSMDT